MTLTMTAVSRKQWKKVGTVALWVILTNGIGILTAYLTAKPEFLAIGPSLNIAGKAVQQIFQTEEDQAFSQLPVRLVSPSLQPTGSSPVVAAPVSFTSKDKAGPNIGSTANQ